MTRRRVQIIEKGISAWSSRFAQLEDFLKIDHDTKTCLIYAESAPFKDQQLRKEICRQFKIPSTFFSDTCQRMNGFFGSSTLFDTITAVKRHDTWFRFIVKHVGLTPTDYKWHEMSFFSTWSGRSNILICFDLPDGLRRSIEASLSQGSEHACDSSAPYSLHDVVLTGLMPLYDEQVWLVRDQIRNAEKRRDRHMSFLSPPSSKAPDNPTHLVRDRVYDSTFYPRLHDVGRHAAHATEVTTVASDMVLRMIRQCERLCTKPHANPAFLLALQQQMEGLEFNQNVLSNLAARSVANEKRLRDEIGLAYNMIAQADTQATLKMTRAALSDSTAMKTIAIVTMIFLPATFVSAIFSMSFFNFSGSPTDETWTVSREIWIYFAVAIPLTAISLISWYVWHSRLERTVLHPVAGSKEYEMDQVGSA